MYWQCLETGCCTRCSTGCLRERTGACPARSRWVSSSSSSSSSSLSSLSSLPSLGGHHTRRVGERSGLLHRLGAGGVLQTELGHAGGRVYCTTECALLGLHWAMFVQAALRSVRYTPVPMDLGIFIISHRLVGINLLTIPGQCVWSRSTRPGTPSSPWAGASSQVTQLEPLR